MKIVYFIFYALLCNSCFAQSLNDRIQKEINALQQDPQFEHAIISFCVVDSKTGNKIFGKNEQVGLAPASCQKIVTSAAALDILGRDYSYVTDIAYSTKGTDGPVVLYVNGSGDPTMGSNRFVGTMENRFMENLKQALKKAGVNKVNYIVLNDSSKFSSQNIPDGWIWQDVGNYFGAGAAVINWRENQYDLILQPGKSVAQPTTVTAVIPAYLPLKLNNECITGAKKSGDKAYIYHGLNDSPGYIRGSIPLGEKDFSISGAVADPESYFNAALNNFLQQNDLLGTPDSNVELSKKTSLYKYVSPTLDSINFWFLKKSINLYGEAFVKTIALQNNKPGSTDSGINIIRNYWNKRGIEKSALKIIDGSGLSPANRLTTDALVRILQFAKQQSWYPSFYNALPEMNGIKMKDGYIGGVRSYAGYVTLKSGTSLCFAFIVNNFDGSPALAREKIWKVLDLLK